MSGRTAAAGAAGAPGAGSAGSAAPAVAAGGVAGPVAGPGRRAVGGVRTHRAATPWLFLLPGLGITVVFGIFPFLNTVALSFTDARPLVGGSFVGLENFRILLSDSLFWTAFRNSLLYVVGVVPPLVLLPLLLALVVRRSVPGIGAIRTALYTPVVASIVAIGVIWQYMLDSRGLVNSVLQWLGVVTAPIPFLTQPALILVSAMVVTVWQGLGYYMVVYLAVLANVPKELDEAAQCDGAGVVRRFLSVTLPAMRSTMVLVSVISSVSAFRVFSEVFLLGGPGGGPGGGATTLVMLIRQSGTGLSARLGYSSAVGLVLFLLTVGLLAANLWINHRRDRERV